MTRLLWFVTHPEVALDPAVPITEWPLSPRGRGRMAKFCAAPGTAAIAAVYASAERKAQEAARMLAAARGVAVETVPGLGENDRSSTGYLPPAEFEAVADRFFAEPEASVRGWERAVDAQARIVAAVTAVAARAPAAGDAAVIAHGAVGALLFCHLLGVAIDRRHDQPGRGGGNRLQIALPGLRLVSGWADIAPGD